MEESLRKRMELHFAGATVRHRSPFASLTVPDSMVTPDERFIQTWVAPFYMSGIRDPERFRSQYLPLREEVNPDLISSLLTWFNWRSRIVGAYFAGIEELKQFTDHIGRLLLRSDVCYAGEGYALALASFNTDKAIVYLTKYLDYYLTRKDLWFDQGSVMAALAYLDTVNETSLLAGYVSKWEDYVADKPNLDLSRSIEHFAELEEALRSIARNGT